MNCVGTFRERCLPPNRLVLPQGTEEEELERVMEVSGMRDADVWAPLAAGGDDPDLYDSEEEEFGGRSAYFVGAREEKVAAV